MSPVSETAGRYQRSTGGMVGALVVTVGVIIAFVVFRAVTRDDLQVDREAIDYLETVGALQESDLLDPVYPPTLPKGWKAVDATFDAEDLTWSLDLNTGDVEFVGVVQSKRKLADLLETHVDAKASKGDLVTLDSPLASTWQAFSDEGGDYALVAKVKGFTVLVFGTASEDEIKDLTSSLVSRPLPRR
jgi:hypothetical protein